MPKLPHVSGAQAVKIFERLGFVIMRQSGSHTIMRKGSAGCVVPNHKEIKVGTLAGCCVKPEYRLTSFCVCGMTNCQLMQKSADADGTAFIVNENIDRKGERVLLGHLQAEYSI